MILVFTKRGFAAAQCGKAPPFHDALMKFEARLRLEPQMRRSLKNY
jgi:hypothetical protein